jgi:excisionase family DNA binding protein
MPSVRVTSTGAVFAHHGERLLYRVEEAAELLAVSRAKVYDLIMTGVLESVKIGGSRRIPRGALEKYVARLSSETAGH